MHPILPICILLIAAASSATADNVLRRYEAECREELSPNKGMKQLNPCQRACELEKLGLLTDGKFDKMKAFARINETDGLGLYPDDKRMLLRVAIGTCDKEIGPAKSADTCAAASAMYYCINMLLQPEGLYMEDKKGIQRAEEDVGSKGCVCNKFGTRRGPNQME